jgi:CheY-like chemotaxis protein
VKQIVIKKLLNKLGHSVTIVNNGEEAVRMVKNSDYDLILMDWRMLKMDGIEATKLIRSFGEKYTDLPIFALAANFYVDDQALCIKAGMNDVLNKPLTLEALNKTLNKVLSA